MRIIRILGFLVIIALASARVWSSSVDEARRLHAGGSAKAAMAEIEAVLDGEATAAEKAEALDLLGAIAVDNGDLTMARQAWTRLLDEYPNTEAARDADTKLKLVAALLGSEAPIPATRASSESPPVPPSSPPAVEPIVQSEVRTPTPRTESPVRPPAPPPASPPAAPAPTEPATPAAAAATAPTAPAAVSSDRVLVAARGKPYDAVMEASDRMVSFLRQQGVDAESATGGIPVVEDSKMVLPLLIQKGRQESAGSVLLLTADYQSMQKMVLECYLPSGERLWKEKVSGGTGWKGRPHSVSGVTEELYERFETRLGKRVGAPGLPISLE